MFGIDASYLPMFGLGAPRAPARDDSNNQKRRESSKGERICPLFHKKKIFSLEKTKALEEQMGELLRDNDQNIENEKVMLEKIRDRDDAFLARLETYLERFKRDKVDELVLVQDMLPEWSPQKKPENPEPVPDVDAATNEDSMERLKEWYEAMEEYVNVQREGASQIISDWFTLLDKSSNEGEPEADVYHPVARFTTVKQINRMINRVNVFWCLCLIFVCLLSVYWVYEPEDVEKCTTDPGQCIVDNMIKFCVFVHDHYLAFHDISLESSPMSSPNRSDAVSSENPSLV